MVPPFDPGEFASIEARRTPVAIDDAAVDQALERLRERAARFEPVEDGIVGDGHTVVVDLERQGFDKGGKAGEKTKHERVPVEIGAAANPPGLDDELKGLTPGAQKSFRLRFPDDYSVEELAGTEVAYDVTVHDIRKRIVPALDDEFAKDLGEFDTLDALRDARAAGSRGRGARSVGAAGARRRAEEARGARAVPGAGRRSSIARSIAASRTSRAG